LALGIKKRALQLGAQRLHNDRPLKVLISSSIHPPSPVLSVPLRLPRVPAGVDRTETKGAPVLAVTGHELPAFSVPATGHGVPSAGPAGVPTAGLRRAASHGRVPAPAAAAAGVQGQQRRLHERMVRYPDTVVYQPVGWHANVSFQHELCLSVMHATAWIASEFVFC
jgi:hypothetical protein